MSKSSKKQLPDPPERTENNAILAYFQAQGTELALDLDNLPSVHSLTGAANLDPFEVLGPDGKPVPKELGRFSRVERDHEAEELKRKHFTELPEGYHMRGLTGQERGRIFFRPAELEEQVRQQRTAEAYARLLGKKKPTTEHIPLDGVETPDGRTHHATLTKSERWTPMQEA